VASLSKQITEDAAHVFFWTTRRYPTILKSSLDAVRLRGISKEVVGTLATASSTFYCVLCREERRNGPLVIRGTPKFLV